MFTSKLRNTKISTHYLNLKRHGSPRRKSRIYCQDLILSITKTGVTGVRSSLAREAVNKLAESVEDIFQKVGEGGALDIIKVRKSVEPMIDSIARNPDA